MRLKIFYELFTNFYNERHFLKSSIESLMDFYNIKEFQLLKVFLGEFIWHL